MHNMGSHRLRVVEEMPGGTGIVRPSAQTHIVRNPQE
jgi:hypothetical protein